MPRRRTVVPVQTEVSVAFLLTIRLDDVESRGVMRYNRTFLLGVLKALSFGCTAGVWKQVYLPKGVEKICQQGQFT